MRTFYFSKKTYLLILVLLLLFSLVVFLLNSILQPVSTALAPYRQGDGGLKQVSLTINVDWGEEYLPAMLDVLAQHNIKATFFLTGRWAELNPDLAAQIAEAGHEIGNHAYSHSSPNNDSYDKNVSEILKAEAAIEAATAIKPSLFAPPSGESEQHVLQAAADLGYTTILWSVDTIDWQRPEAAVIIERVKEKIHDGAIILAHPTESTLEALPTILVDLQLEGYNFVTVSQNIGL